MEIFKIVMLCITGPFLMMVGLSRLANPIKNYSKNSGIELGNDVNILNEMRGVGAVMLCAGAIIFLGVFLSQLMLTSFIVALLIFLGFALGRLISFGADGKPNKLIVKGLAFEIVFGLANAVALISIFM